MRTVLLIAIGLALAAASGCVRRTIRITSDPTGALVWLNDREVGRTPVEVDFVHYGTYDVRLALEGYEPLSTGGRAKAPLWDAPGLDLVAEAIPGEPRVEVHWHYDLAPLDDDRDALLTRARELRETAGLPEGDEAAPAAADRTP